MSGSSPQSLCHRLISPDRPLGVSRQTIASDLAAIREEWLASAPGDLGKLKALQHQRLDVALNGIWENVAKGHLGSIDRFIKIEERRAKLLGLDEPFALAMDATVGHDTGWGMSQESADLLAAMFGVPPETLEDDVMTQTPSGFDRAEDDPSE